MPQFRHKEVAPLVGAWIEMVVKRYLGGGICVAPLVGAWIEITEDKEHKMKALDVAPLVGAWIEI